MLEKLPLNCTLKTSTPSPKSTFRTNESGVQLVSCEPDVICNCAEAPLEINIIAAITNTFRLIFNIRMTIYIYIFGDAKVRKKNNTQQILKKMFFLNQPKKKKNENYLLK